MGQHRGRRGGALPGRGRRAFDAVEGVADREDARRRGTEGRVHAGAPGAGVQGDAAAAGQFVIGDPVAGEDHRVAGEDPCAAVPVADGHAGQPAPAAQLAHRRLREQRDPRHGGGPRALRDHRHHVRTRPPQRAHRLPGHRLGAHHHGPPADGQAVPVDRLQQLPGGQHTLRAGARDQPGAAGAFPGARGEDDGAGRDPLQARRAGGLQGQRAGPAGGRDAGADRGPGGDRGLRRPRRVLGTPEPGARRPAEASVVEVARHSARLRLAFQDLDPPGARGRQPGCV